MKRCLLPLALAALVGLGAPKCLAHPYDEMAQQLARSAHDAYRQATAAHVAHLPKPGCRGGLPLGTSTRDHAEIRQQVLEAYLQQLVPAMQVEPAAAHLPRDYPVVGSAESAPQDDTRKRWLRYYQAAKQRLRPRLAYNWSSDDQAGTTVLVLSEKHVQAMRDNFDVLIWYRDQLDAKIDEANHIGAKYFALFLDHIVDGWLDGMPAAPRISVFSGEVETPEWTLNEKTLEQQLVMAYRYLIAKYQIYPEYDLFAPADQLLWTTLVKLSYLMGAQFDFSLLLKQKVELAEVGTKHKWKLPLARALAVLQAKAKEDPMLGPAEDSPYADEQACVINIPPPKKKATAKTPPSKNAESDEQRIEIIIRPPTKQQPP